MSTRDPFGLDRFVTAQAPVIEAVTAELRAGQKRSHWMWFVFPQIAGLGMSAASRHYAISGLDEARAYLAHDVLGPRLVELTEVVNRVEGRTAERIFGGIDAQKFFSSMTLFNAAAPEEAAFGAALARYFDGAKDKATLERI